jgi:hypothetical protein
MGPASPYSAAANELREEANGGRLIAAAAVCLPAPDRFGTWENEVPSLVCNASAPASGRWKLFWHRYLWVANRRQRGREPLVRSGACHDVRRRRLRREVSRVPRSHRAHAHIAGPPDLAKKLFDLPEGTRVHVEGAIERRSHTTCSASRIPWTRHGRSSRVGGPAPQTWRRPPRVNAQGSAPIGRHPPGVVAAASGRRSSSMVGMSSDTVGWMCIARRMSEYGALAYMTSRME